MGKPANEAQVVFNPDDNMTYMAQYENCGSTVTSLASTDAIPDLRGACGLAENTAPPEAPSETEGTGGETSGGAGRRGLGAWVVLVAAWWFV